jgi:hypothetical protein
MPTTSLTLRVQPGSDGLHRVVSTCRRRSLEIVAMSYLDQQITLTVAGNDWHAGRIDRWLSALVDVFDVQHHGSA